MDNFPLISVVIPVYKAEHCLDELYQRLKAALETISPDFEIVLVEDCGGDHSWQVIERLAAADPRVRGIQFSRNFGQHYGITAGLDHCHGDWVVVMDCDLQDRPEEIPRLYAKAQEGYDIVLARRGARQRSVLETHCLMAVLQGIQLSGRYRIRRRDRQLPHHVAQGGGELPPYARATALLSADWCSGWVFPPPASRWSTTSVSRANPPTPSPSCGNWLPKPSSPIPTSRCGWRCVLVS